jgi:hypothetical protein
MVTFGVALAAAQIPAFVAEPHASHDNAAGAKKWQTPWGDPDLQGSWSNATTTPLERPAKFAGREFQTPEERAAQDKETAIGRDRRAEPGTPKDVAGAYNAFWWEWGALTAAPR